MRLLSWDDLGNTKAGRPNLGPHTTVHFYRLLLLSMKRALEEELGPEPVDRMLKHAGEVAGQLVYHQFLAQARDLYSLVRDLSHFFKVNRVAILRMEQANEQEMRFVFTVRESLSGSRAPSTDPARCSFDEGFLSGILSSFYGRRVEVNEVESWGKEQRVSRYEACSQPVLMQVSTHEHQAPSEVAA